MAPKGVAKPKAKARGRASGGGIRHAVEEMHAGELDRMKRAVVEQMDMHPVKVKRIHVIIKSEELLQNGTDETEDSFPRQNLKSQLSGIPKNFMMERLTELGEDTLRERDKGVQANLLWM